MDEKMKEKILKAIGMRAAGYETSESVEEYTVTDGENVFTLPAKPNHAHLGTFAFLCFQRKM